MYVCVYLKDTLNLMGSFYVESIKKRGLKKKQAT